MAERSTAAEVIRAWPCVSRLPVEIRDNLERLLAARFIRTDLAEQARADKKRAGAGDPPPAEGLGPGRGTL